MLVTDYGSVGSHDLGCDCGYEVEYFSYAFFISSRGNPLYLCQERYQKLRKLWRTHAIAEEVAHCLESNRNMMSIDWANL